MKRDLGYHKHSSKAIEVDSDFIGSEPSTGWGLTRAVRFHLRVQLAHRDDLGNATVLIMLLTGSLLGVGKESLLPFYSI